MSSQLPKYPTFSKWSPLFDNSYSKTGQEFSELTAKQHQFAKDNSGKYLLEPEIPKNIAGLINRTGGQRKLPSTVKFFRTISSFERNGMFNIHTPNLNIRFTVVSFFVFLSWGWSAFQITAWNTIQEKDNYEEGSIYDKLTTRTLPPAKMYTRPG